MTDNVIGYQIDQIDTYSYGQARDKANKELTDKRAILKARTAQLLKKADEKKLSRSNEVAASARQQEERLGISFYASDTANDGALQDTKGGSCSMKEETDDLSEVSHILLPSGTGLLSSFVNTSRNISTIIQEALLEMVGGDRSLLKELLGWADETNVPPSTGNNKPDGSFISSTTVSRRDPLMASVPTVPVPTTTTPTKHQTQTQDAGATSTSAAKVAGIPLFRMSGRKSSSQDMSTPQSAPRSPLQFVSPPQLPTYQEPDSQLHEEENFLLPSSDADQDSEKELSPPGVGEGSTVSTEISLPSPVASSSHESLSKVEPKPKDEVPELFILGAFLDSQGLGAYSVAIETNVGCSGLKQLHELCLLPFGKVAFKITCPVCKWRRFNILRILLGVLNNLLVNFQAKLVREGGLSSDEARTLAVAIKDHFVKCETDALEAAARVRESEAAAEHEAAERVARTREREAARTRRRLEARNRRYVNDFVGIYQFREVNHLPFLIYSPIKPC